MKILHVGPVRHEAGAAGPTQSISGLVTAQARIGLKVGLLSCIPLQKGQVLKELPNVQIVGSLLKNHHNPWHLSANYIDKIKDEFGRPDLVNFHSTYIPFQTALARSCLKMGWPYIITPRGGLTRFARSIKRLKKNLANTFFFRSYVRHAQAIHALTRNEAEEIKYFTDNKETFIVPNGIPESLFIVRNDITPVDLGEFRNDAKLVFGFIGRIDVYIKGLDLLLKAIANLIAEPNESGCKLLMIGPFFSKRDKNYLLSLIDKYRLHNIVKITGPKYADEKWAYLLACDVVVLSSRSEGMPMASIEAMALGKPCLVTEESRVANIVLRAGGWTCKAQSDSIRQAMQRVYADKATLGKRGKQAQQLMRDEFTWDKIAHKCAIEYRRIISGN